MFTNLRQEWMWQLVGCLTHANNTDHYFCWHWFIRVGHILHSACLMVVTKMSPTARKTAFVAAFIVGLVMMYGYGYRSGRNAQLSMDTVMEIVKAQYICRMEMK